MKAKYLNNPKIQEVKRMYLAGHNPDEIGGELGLSPLTVKTYLIEAKVSLDEAKYARLLHNGKVVFTEAGRRWAREWDEARIPLNVLFRMM